MGEQLLGVFFDVNVVINALLDWHNDRAPVELEAERYNYMADPPWIALALIAEGDRVNGQRLVFPRQRIVSRGTR